jgi:hypothetical protein
MITVRYNCPGCGVKAAAVSVRPRRPGENIVEWVNEAVGRCGLDHMTRSPVCNHGRADLMIPAPKGDEPIGAEPPAGENADE